MGLRIAEGRNLVVERFNQLLTLRVIQRSEFTEEAQHHDALKTGEDRVIRRRLTQYIPHTVTQGVTGIHRAEEIALERNVIPLHASVVLYATPFDRLIK